MRFLRAALKNIAPLIVTRSVRKLNLSASNKLFDGSDDLFKTVVSQCRLYGEYGCGASTRWVLANTTATVMTVDSDKHWIRSIDPSENFASRLTSHWVNLGELGSWGRPLSYSHRHQFSEYTDWIWTQKDKPDVVLIDGRFRVCCFLTTLRNAKEGTQILFDDYMNRQHYHIIEEFVERSEGCGRQGLFVVPPKGKLDINEIDKQIAAFRNVFD